MTVESRRALLLLLVLPLIAGQCDDAGPGEPAGYAVITRVIDLPEPPAVADEPWAIRYLGSEIADRLFEPGALASGDTLSIALFDSEVIASRITRVHEVAGHLNVRTEHLGAEKGFALLSLGEGRLMGTITRAAPDRKYYVRFDPRNRAHVLVEVDPEREDVVPEAPPEEWP